jgi:hypothetical protein
VKEAKQMARVYQFQPPRPRLARNKPTHQTGVKLPLPAHQLHQPVTEPGVQPHRPADVLAVLRQLVAAVLNRTRIHSAFVEALPLTVNQRISDPFVQLHSSAGSSGGGCGWRGCWGCAFCGDEKSEPNKFGGRQQQPSSSSLSPPFLSVAACSASDAVQRLSCRSPTLLHFNLIDKRHTDSQLADLLAHPMSSRLCCPTTGSGV